MPNDEEICKRHKVPRCGKTSGRRPCCAVWPYLIFYTVHKTDDEVRVERILHSARDIDQWFFHDYN